MAEKIIFVEWCAKDILDGTQNMDAITELAYRRVIDLIYSTNDNLLDNDSLQYATKTGSKWKKIRKELIEVHHKLYVEDGKIRNKKCSEKLQKVRKNIEQKKAAGKASAEKRKSLENNKTGSTAVECAVGDTVEENTPKNVNESSTNQESKNPSIKDITNVISKKVSLEELSVDHVMPWLMDKRAAGLYTTIDEHRLLEKFKDYCQSKGKRYKNYVAAFRNAFEWNNAPQTGGNEHGRKSKSDIADEATARALARINTPREPLADSGPRQAELRCLQHVRERPEGA